jgi:hypothetical protein
MIQPVGRLHDSRSVPAFSRTNWSVETKEQIMSETLNNTNNTINTNAAADPQTAAAPEQVIEQLRALRQTIAEVTPLTAKQRRSLRDRAVASNEVTQAQISAIGASDAVRAALGRQSEDVRVIGEEANRWIEVENELKALLAGIHGANLVRRQKLALLSGQGYNIAVQLARDPEHADLVPHVEEVRRLKRLGNRKKTPASPGTPEPQPAPAPQPIM